MSAVVLHGVSHRVSLHIVPGVDFTPPLPPPHPQSHWMSILIHASLWTQVRILLGTLTHTWNFWRVGQAHTSFDELYQVAFMDVHRSRAPESLYPCRHWALPPLKCVLIWWVQSENCCFSLCFSDDWVWTSLHRLSSSWGSLSITCSFPSPTYFYWGFLFIVDL